MMMMMMALMMMMTLPYNREWSSAPTVCSICGVYSTMERKVAPNVEKKSLH
jgi:hypothetical protein